MKDIFISYYWKSKQIVQKIVDLLKSKDGYQIWMDERVLKLDENIKNEIKQEIDDCKLFIGFITKNYCDSLKCQSETHYAFDKKKKRIYVMLEENIGDDPSDIGCIVSLSLRLNAYQHLDNENWSEDLHKMLSSVINQQMDNTYKQLPNLTFKKSFKMDLESLVKCSLCNNRFNLDHSERASCRKPMQTNCNMQKIHENVLCMKCLKDRKETNSLGSQTFLCPFDRNDHLLSYCTDVKRLHNIIRHFEMKEFFNNLKNGVHDYDDFRERTTIKIVDQVNEAKRKVKEHVDEIISELNKYAGKVVEQLDKHVEEWIDKQERIKESLRIDEIMNSTEELLIKLENDLKKIEISVNLNGSDGSIDQEVNDSVTKLASLNETIATLNDQILQESIKLKNETSVHYNKETSINEIKKVFGSLEMKNPLWTDTPEIVQLCERLTKENNYFKIKELIEQENANSNCNTGKAQASLVIASQNGHLEITQFLIQNGVDINQKFILGSTALYWASINGRFETVKFLIENHANIDEKNRDGWTALMAASWSGHLEIVKYLIQNGANINKNDNNDRTALILASENGYLEIVQFLIQNQAQINRRNNFGCTALFLASHKGHLETVKFLIQNRARINKKNKDGWTALMAASWNGHFEIVKFLTQNGAKINNALDVALNRRHFETASFLVNNGANHNNCILQ